MEKKRVAPYAREVRDRAVRMVLEHREAHGSQWSAIQSIASKIGCSGETARATGCGRPSVMRAYGLARRARSGIGSRLSNGRTASCGKPMRSLGRRPRILPRRSSTARRGDDRVHRRSPWDPWGRADLPAAADRPVDVLGAGGCPARSFEKIVPRQAGRRAAFRDRPRACGERRALTAPGRCGGSSGARASRCRAARCSA